jgi:hypothetical protein
MSLTRERTRQTRIEGAADWVGIVAVADTLNEHRLVAVPGLVLTRGEGGRTSQRLSPALGVAINSPRSRWVPTLLWRRVMVSGCRFTDAAGCV